MAKKIDQLIDLGKYVVIQIPKNALQNGLETLRTVWEKAKSVIFDW